MECPDPPERAGAHSQVRVLVELVDRVRERLVGTARDMVMRMGVPAARRGRAQSGGAGTASIRVGA
eukprot:3684124-Rhodomonas_salina.1